MRSSASAAEWANRRTTKKTTERSIPSLRTHSSFMPPGLWLHRLADAPIFPVYAHARWPIQNPLSNRYPKARGAGVFDVRFGVVRNHLIWYEGICYWSATEIGGPIMSSKTKRAALYTRVSTDRQTVENQISELRQVAERRG